MEWLQEALGAVTWEFCWVVSTIGTHPIPADCSSLSSKAAAAFDVLVSEETLLLSGVMVLADQIFLRPPCWVPPAG